ncbi:hypothetical protein KR018_008779, partial [Drosophila ironensis]
ELVCSIKKCKKGISANQPSVLCWLCNNLAHAKCAGFNAVSDALARSGSGLHYCCENCRGVQNEMRSFMRQTKTEFKEVLGLFKKADAAFQALNTRFNNLQLLNESPKRKKPSSCLPQTENQLPLNLPQLNILKTPLPYSTPLATTPVTTKHSDPDCIIVEECKQRSDDVPTVSSMVIPKKKKSPTPKGTRTSGLPVSNEISGHPPAIPKSLKVIPPSKHIFVSRLAPDTSEIDILAYIQAKVKADIKREDVVKFKYSYTRHTSSFKIRVPLMDFDNICSANFWPEHIFVQE